MYIHTHTNTQVYKHMRFMCVVMRVHLTWSRAYVTQWVIHWWCVNTNAFHPSNRKTRFVCVVFCVCYLFLCVLLYMGCDAWLCCLAHVHLIIPCTPYHPMYTLLSSGVFHSSHNRQKHTHRHSFVGIVTCKLVIVWLHLAGRRCSPSNLRLSAPPITRCVWCMGGCHLRHEDIRPSCLMTRYVGCVFVCQP